MSGDYLWDGSGEPDPQIARLEAALRPLRRVPPAPELPAHRPGLTIPPLSDWRALAAAAAVLLALASALLPARASGPGWDLVWLADGGGSDPGRKLREGEWLETGQRRARLEVGEIGVVRLEPLTRVAVLDVGREAHRLSLARGTLHATIWAPPGRFLVETKAARAVDLGCQYTLEVGGRRLRRAARRGGLGGVRAPRRPVARSRRRVAAAPAPAAGPGRPGSTRRPPRSPPRST